MKAVADLPTPFVAVLALTFLLPIHAHGQDGPEECDECITQYNYPDPGDIEHWFGNTPDDTFFDSTLHHTGPLDDKCSDWHDPCGEGTLTQLETPDGEGAGIDQLRTLMAGYGERLVFDLESGRAYELVCARAEKPVPTKIAKVARSSSSQRETTIGDA